jgi:hypothetical protein
MVAVVERNLTANNYLDRLPRVPEIPGRPWASVRDSYTLRELLQVEALLRAEITHLHAGLANRSLMMPARVARERKNLLIDQMSAVRNIRLIRFPTGQERREGLRPRVEQKWAMHLARMFHRWMEEETDESWKELMTAYEKFPPGALAYTPKHDGIDGENAPTTNEKAP